MCPTYKKTEAITHVDIVCDSYPPQNNLLELIGPRVEIKYNFTMCFCPIFGKISKENFIEYLEINSMFGADHFIVYNTSFTPKHLSPIMHGYQDIGLMTIYQWNAYPSQSFAYHGQATALNDCLYRSKFHSRYMVNTDLDEFIVPMKQNSWKEVLEEVDREKLAGSYSFRNLFMVQEKPKRGQDTPNGIDHINTLSKFVPRPPIMEHKTRSKFICVPQKTTVAVIHYVWEMIPGATTKVMAVNSGLLFHYNTYVPHQQGSEKQEAFNSSVNPYRMKDFRKAIIKRITEVHDRY